MKRDDAARRGAAWRGAQLLAGQLTGKEDKCGDEKDAVVAIRRTKRSFKRCSSHVSEKHRVERDLLEQGLNKIERGKMRVVKMCIRRYNYGRVSYIRFN